MALPPNIKQSDVRLKKPVEFPLCPLTRSLSNIFFSENDTDISEESGAGCLLIPCR